MARVPDNIMKNRPFACNGRHRSGRAPALPGGFGWIPTVLFLWGCGQIGIEKLPVPGNNELEDGETEPSTGMREDADTSWTEPQGTGAPDTATRQVVVETDALTETEPPVPTERPTDSDGEDGTPTGTESPDDTGRPTDTAQPSGAPTESHSGNPMESDSATDLPHPTETATATASAQPTETATASATTSATGTASATETETETETDTYQPECVALYSSALVCDGFEDGILLDTDMNAGGSLTVVSSPVYDGAASLHARAASTYCLAHVYGDFTPRNSGTLYFRAYYYLPSGSMTGLVKLAAFRGWNTSTEHAELNVDFNVHQGGIVEIHSHTNGLDYQSGPGQVVENTWFCLRGSVLISDTAGVATLGINGTTILTVESLDTRPPSGVSLADFGIGWTQDGTPPMNVFVDNIVVDTSPVPCD